MFWSLLQNVGGKGVSFIVFIVLARLLTPEIFGLIGMLMIFIQLSQVLVRAGFNEALIQKKDTDEEDYSSVFWINLAVSILIYVILFLTAPFIADFYGQPVLTKLTRVLSLVFVINAFSYVQDARLQKEMSFKTLTIIHIPSTIIGGAVSIIMAIQGFGVWSLIALQLVTRVVYAIQIWFYAKWKLLFTFNTAKAKGLFSFGWKLMAAGMTKVIFDNIYLVVIGKFFPVSYVGYYYNAQKLVYAPAKTITQPLRKVTFSAFSYIQNENKKLKIGVKKATQQILFWLCPMLVFAGVLAEPLFRFVLTEKWVPAVPFFQILCIVGIVYPLNGYNLNIINVKGRSDLYLKLAIVKRVLALIGIIIAIPLGIWMLIVFQSLNTIIAYFLNAYFSGKFINYPIKEQLKDILPIILLSVFVGCLVYLIDLRLSNAYDWVRVLIGFSIGVGLYWLIAWQQKFEPYKDFRDLLKEKSSVFLKKN